MPYMTAPPLLPPSHHRLLSISDPAPIPAASTSTAVSPSPVPLRPGPHQICHAVELLTQICSASSPAPFTNVIGPLLCPSPCRPAFGALATRTRIRPRRHIAAVSPPPVGSSASLTPTPFSTDCSHTRSYRPQKIRTFADVSADASGRKLLRALDCAPRRL